MNVDVLNGDLLLPRPAFQLLHSFQLFPENAHQPHSANSIGVNGIVALPILGPTQNDQLPVPRLQRWQALPLLWLIYARGRQLRQYNSCR
jgi:hypothetical protein